MNILYIHQYFTTREGATGTRSYEFSKYLVKQGHKVTVITGDSMLSSVRPNKETFLTKHYLIDGINVIAIRNKYSNYMGNIQRILSFLKFMFASCLIGLRQKNYDIVYATSTPLTVAIPAICLKIFKKIPYVFEVRDLWPEAPIQIGAIKSKVLIKFLRMIEKKAYDESAHIVTLSPGMSDGVYQTGIPKNKVTMIPNCSDLDLFDEKINDLTYESKYKLKDKFVVVHGGSMGIANGLDYVIDAAIELKKKEVNDIVFVLAGDGKTRPYLEKKSRENNLNNVVFTGSISRKDMPKLLSLANITITSFRNLPILATNSPNKFFDSLAAGKPVIVNSNGWTREIVEKHNIGYYVDPESPKQLAQLLIEIKNKKEMLEEMGKRARQLAEEQYERSKLAKQVERILVGVLKANK